MSIFEWVMVSIVGSIALGGFCIASVLAYRGFLGMTLFKWTRYPFAFAGIYISILGGACLGIGMNGIPAVKQDNEEEITDQAESNEHEIEEPSNDDDQYARAMWSLIGNTPSDVRNECVAKAQNATSDDEEVDGWNFDHNPRESLEDFKNRRKYEKAS